MEKNVTGPFPFIQHINFNFMSSLLILSLLAYSMRKSCQGTLIFSNFSIIYFSFPSITFHCTSLYYSSMMSTIISKHLQAFLSTALTFPLLYSIFLSYVLSFAFLSSLSDRLYDGLYFTYL